MTPPESSDIPGRLGPAFTEALVYATELHACQRRKGGEVPYIGHLLSVAALVIEDEGAETQVIAALLHDAAEDQGGEPRLLEIERRFGTGVAGIVRACSDTVETPKPPWRKRKEQYLEHLETAPPEVLRVSLADKLDNARAILRDFRVHGSEIWSRFKASAEGQLWYYRALAAVFCRQCPESGMAAELDRTVAELDRLVQDATG